MTIIYDTKNADWSYSRLTSYENCPYGFYLNYILRDWENYPKENNYYAEVGSFVHKILEMIFKGELSPEDAPMYFADYYDENVLCKVKQATMDKTYEKIANYFAEQDYKWYENYDVVGVEEKLNFEISGYKFVAYVDLLLRDRRDNKLVILDHKSSTYPFKKDGNLKASAKNSFEHYFTQMHLYAYGVHNKYGEYPKELLWNFFKEGGVVKGIPFEKNRMDSAVKWLVDTIRQIESEESYSEKQDYFFCVNLCNFRGACEFAKDMKERMRKKWRHENG